MGWIVMLGVNGKAGPRPSKEIGGYLVGLYSILMESPIPFIACYPWGKPISCNQAFCDLTGYKKEEITGIQNCALLTPEDYRHFDEIVHENARKTGKRCTYQKELLTKEGARIPVEASVYVMTDKEGYARYQYTIYKDISGQESLVEKCKMLEAKVEEEQKKLEEARMDADLYIDLMSHDIGNLNQVTMGYIELAIDAIPENNDCKKLLEVPLTTLDCSARMIQNLKKARTARTGEMKLAPVDLGKAIEASINESLHVPGRRIVINYAPVSGMMVLANEYLKDIFSNLIDNAIRYSGDPVIIGIEVMKISGDGMASYRISIDDNGPGIPNAQKEGIFNRARACNVKVSGRGVGLYLVKALVEAYKGRVRVEDRISGDHTKGSKFVVMLPAII